MTQRSIDWDRELELPINGLAPAARHASATGAVAAKKRYGQKVLAYVTVLAHAGSEGVADHQALAALATVGVSLVGVGSINSIRNSLGDLVEHTGAYEETGFHTKRGKYRLSAAGRAWQSTQS